MDQLITAEQRAANRIAFDTLTENLRKKNEILAVVKKEIDGIKGRFTTLCAFFASSGDEITDYHKALYNKHIDSFVHSLQLYIIPTDSEGIPYINPVTDVSKETVITLPICFPHSTVEQPVITIDNMTADIDNNDLYIGDLTFHCLSAENLAQTFDVIVEEPTSYFSKNEFLMGMTYEIEKLCLFHSRVCLGEQRINAAIKYIAELKGFGIY